MTPDLSTPITWARRHPGGLLLVGAAIVVALLLGAATWDLLAAVGRLLMWMV